MNADHHPDRRWAALVLLCAAQFLVVLDASIVNVALPSIKEDLGFAQNDLAWVVNAYVLVFGGFLLLGGRLADIVGRRRIFMAGLVVFAVGSLLGGLSTSTGTLLAARALQGLGGALFSPAALAIITELFREGAERNRALSAWGAVAGSGGAAGVLLGGVLTDGLGWEWVFFVNVPVAAVAVASTRALIAESTADGLGRSFDVAGALTVTAGTTVLVYALVDASDAGWASTQTIVLLVLAAVLIGVFALIELRRSQPLVPFAFFRNRTAAGSDVVALLVGAALFSMFYFVSLYLQQVLGYEPLKAGLAYLPLAATIIISAGAASRLVARFGLRPVLGAGLLAVAGGLAWFAQVSADGRYVVDVLPASVLTALGLGLAFVPLTIGATSGVTEDEGGLASGLLNTAQQVGGALGLAVLVSVADSRSADAARAAGGDPTAAPQILTEGFQAAFWVGTGFAVAGLLALALLPRSADRPITADQGAPAAI
ncbi:MAG TPA: MFS transporter [Capillimicrobium sp.]|jgi:EmrB/QacA subfamily drug resistance transporter|nr:MFS transporter [Capillimicrobium sp.]